MNKMVYLIIAGILIAGVCFFIFRAKDKPSLDDYFISTEGQSNDRVKSLNLDKPTEDASYILDVNKLSLPHIESKNDTIGYRADPEREWIINLVQVNGGLFNKSDLLELFDYEWRSQFESEIYGFASLEKRWTFAFAGDSPDTYKQIQIAINVQDVYSEENQAYDPKKLERYISELEKRIVKYPTKLKFEQTESIVDAIAKAKKLIELHKEFDNEAIIVLQSDAGFRGTEAWDVLLCIGLEWGDGDLFHWNNNSDFGSDQHFSVWTTTQPNYFLPEQVKEGQMNPENLVFGFSIPRSADPKNIFDIMINSVKYAQKRLGGRILDKDGAPFNEASERKEIGELIEKMKAKGISAGSDKALVMF
jgi:cell division protein ZipA